MKKDFLKNAVRSPWALVGFSALGVVIGAGLTFVALTVVMPGMLPDAPIQTDTPVGEDHEPNTDDVIGGGFELHSGAYGFMGAFAEQPRELSKEERHAFLSATFQGRVDAETEQAYREALWGHMEGSATDNANGCWLIPAIRHMGNVRTGGLHGASEPMWNDADIFLVDYLNCEGMGSPVARLYMIRPQESGDLFAIGSVPFVPTVDATAGEKEKTSPAAILTAVLRGIQFLPDASFMGLEMPQELAFDVTGLPSGVKKRLAQVPAAWFEQYRYRFDLEGEITEVGKTTDGIPLYLSGREDGCLLAFAPDGKVYQYASRVAATRDEGGDGTFDDQMYPSITWDRAYTGATGKAYEGRSVTGCGSMGCTFVVSAEIAEAGGGLVRAGVAANGDTIFVPARPQDHPSIRALYDGWYVPDGGEKVSLDGFLAQYPVPIFYWQDVLGRWVEYRSTAILPMAECGKPVIYLYPEQTTDVSVKLPSFINVTVSDPTYPSTGWHVTAQPSGQLTSHEDGKTYGSLYWEGTGVGYVPPKDGFIVKDGEVKSFLRDILPRYGLNQTEAREFMEFWIPEMQGAPYYRVSFLTSAWSQAAPLFVSPRPQTSIRIFMDWKPLSAPISIPEPEITTPERDGFTLVEWGGTLWKK